MTNMEENKSEQVEVSEAPKKKCYFLFASPLTGAVRKIRFSTTLLYLATFAVSAIVGGSLFVVIDYSRTQAGYLHSSLWAYFLEKERDKLLAENKELEEELRSFKENHAGVLAYEEQVKARLSELASLLPLKNQKNGLSEEARGKARGSFSTPSLGRSLAAEKAVSPSKKGVSGVGGAEANCEGLSADGCLRDQAMLLMQDEEELKALIERSKTVKDSGNMVATLQSYIHVLRTTPLLKPSQADVNSGFGFRISPFHGGMRMHEGTDFAAEFGSPALATADGVVDGVYRNPTYGLYVEIRHTDRLVTRFAHLSTSLVSPGQKVKRGQKIALVGSSGRSTGPHLHYEVRIDGVARNPQIFFALAEKLSHAF